MKLPHTHESFLSPADCATLIKLIQRYAQNDPLFPARTSTERRTEIPSQLVSPSPGLFVAYPSDERFEHEVPAVRSGARYSVLLWFTDDPGFAKGEVKDLGAAKDQAKDPRMDSKGTGRADRPQRRAKNRA